MTTFRTLCLTAVVLLGACRVSADYFVEDGDFETGALSAAWTEMSPHYPGAPTTVFNGRFEENYPMLEPFAGAYGCAWKRSDGVHNWPGHDSTQPSGYIRQTWTVEAGLYPVNVSGAVLVHHDRIGQPEDWWGAGIRMRLYQGGTDQRHVKWQHEFWPHEGDSYWRYYEQIDNQLPGSEGNNTLNLRDGELMFEIGWITKWWCDLDMCAVDNVQVEIVGMTNTGAGGNIVPPSGDGQVTPPDLENLVILGPPLQGGFGTVFDSALDSGVGLNPLWIAIGDLDRDDHKDVAVANEWSHTITLLFGRGTGALERRIDYATAPYAFNPRSIAVEDFNNDDNPDVLVGCKSTAPGDDPLCLLFLGNGDGSLQTPPLPVVTGKKPAGMAVGSFNADVDAYPDFALAEEGDNTFSVYIGAGDGSFVRADTYETADTPKFIAQGNFDTDAYEDLVVVCWSLYDNIHSYGGTGTGEFVHRQTVSRDDWQDSGAAVADLNEDGTLDVIICGTWPSMAKYWHNHGDGTFWHGEKIGIGRQPTMICATDLNTDEDHYVDYATSNLETCDMMVHLSLDWGFFDLDRIMSYPTGDTPRYVVTDDFNEDGVPDFVVANGDGNRISMLLGRSNGVVRGGLAYSTDNWPEGTRALAFADFDRDDDLDVAVASTGEIDVYENKGDVFLGYAEILSWWLRPGALAAGDLNEDTYPDLVVTDADGTEVVIYFGAGDFSFPNTVRPRPGSNPEDVVLGDFTGNGYLDIATANRGSANITILPGNGSMSFSTKIVTAVGTQPRSLASGYFNDDAILDLATANSGSGDVSVLLGTGGGSFAAAVSYPVGTEPYGIAAGDFNSDSHVDLAATVYAENKVVVLFGDGTGAFGSPAETPAGTAPMYLIADDFNGDGRADLAFGNDGDGTVWMLLCRGDGTFHDPEIYWASRKPRRLASGDMWESGLPELGVGTEDNYRWQLFVNTAAPYVPLPFRITSVERESENEVRLQWQEHASGITVLHTRSLDPADWQPVIEPAPGFTCVIPVAPEDDTGFYKLSRSPSE